jgi:hypothetical protein
MSDEKDLEGCLYYLLPLAESYRRLPRRVGPCIDPDEYLPTDRPSLCLPWPSDPKLRELHALPWVQRLVAVLDQRIAVAVERPAVRHQGARSYLWAVVLMFGCVVELNDRRIHRISIVSPESSELPWKESTLPVSAELITPFEISVWPSPLRELWMEPYEHGFLHQLRTQLGRRGESASRNYAQWVVRQMAKRHWTKERRTWTRQQVATAMDLDPTALEMARGTRAQRVAADCVTAADYNRMLDGLWRFDEVKRVAPKLLVLYNLVHEELPSKVAPLKALRDWVLADSRLKPRHWRWMQRHGTRWLWHVLDCVRPISAEALRNALALGAALEFEGAASPALLRAVAHLYGNPNRPCETGA